MHPVVFHLISGDAVFNALGLLTIAIFFRNKSKLLARWSAFLGGLLLVLTAVPVSVTFYFYWGVIAFAWIVHNPKLINQSNWRALRIIAICSVITITAISEYSWRRPLKIDQHIPQRLIIFGDSVTAGMGENEAITWPQLMREQTDVEVIDHSHMGATVGSGLKQLDQLTFPDGIILVELGGNDILGSTTVDQFSEKLDQFLARLKSTGSTVIMFELPVPPLMNRYGTIQRRLARKHQIQMIPKREFATILGGSASTLDSIHLSQSGHQLMCDLVRNQVTSAFVRSPPEAD